MTYWPCFFRAYLETREEGMQPWREGSRAGSSALPSTGPVLYLPEASPGPFCFPASTPAFPTTRTTFLCPGPSTCLPAPKPGLKCLKHVSKSKPFILSLQLSGTVTQWQGKRLRWMMDTAPQIPFCHLPWRGQRTSMNALKVTPHGIFGQRTQTQIRWHCKSWFSNFVISRMLDKKYWHSNKLWFI